MPIAWIIYLPFFVKWKVDNNSYIITEGHVWKSLVSIISKKKIELLNIINHEVRFIIIISQMATMNNLHI